LKVFLLLFLFVSLAFSGENHKKLEKVSLQLHWKYQFEFAGFIAAKEKGFYKDVGLDVDLKEYDFGIDIEKDVLDGKSEYGIYNSLAFLDFLRDKPIVLISSYFKRAALVLVTTQDIKSPKDLAGKKVMASTKEDFILNYKPYLDGYGVSVDDIKLVPHSYGIEEFARGEVSAMTAFVSNELYKLDKRGIKYNILDPSDDNLYVLQLELFTSEKEVKDHPKRVKKFRDASIKGWQYALTHKDEIAKIIYDKYSKRVSLDEIKEEAQGVEKLILPYTYDIGSIDLNFLSKQIKLFKDNYKVGYDKKIADYVLSEKNFSEIELSQKELEYIKKKKNVKVCLQYDLFPIDGENKGKMVGIASDIYKKISHVTGLEFTPLASHSLEDLKTNLDTKKCELISLYGTKNKLYKTLVPTKTFIQTNFTFISTLDKAFITHIDELNDEVIVTQMQAFKDYLLYFYPNLNIEVQTDKNIMVKKLLNNEVYAIVTLDEQADYLINKYGYGKLKVNGFLPKENPFDGSIGVQKDEPLLYSIIQKALYTISKDEIYAIIDKWRITRYQQVVDYSLVWKVLAVMGVILLIMLYYQRKLQKFNKNLEYLVLQKTKELRRLNESLEITVKEKIDELIKKDEILTVQSKQAVMGEMISMIAHQWRQPLNTISLQISNLQIQQMMHGKIDEENVTKTLKAISETILYLSDTVDDFKTYFHPDKEVTSIKLNDLLAKAVSFVSVRLKSNKINLELVEIPKLEINTFSNELIQVLLNIINNAIDAYDKKQDGVYKIEIYADVSEENIVLRIKDYAGGISSENIKRIFEPYFSTKGKNGTGLGLYMSQMIIQKQFKGEISVQSSNGSSIFIVKFPKDLR
jgi:signal transduction histidine kinase/ABC-type nitrate/sulfonate/bicarbonate transport system substrate-binding protein